jgi:N-acetylglutamate synthase-like GNAT family acetyltransferase
MPLSRLDTRHAHATEPPLPWAADLVTRSGFHVHVRQAQPEDEPALASFFRHVGPEDIRFRFLSALSTVGHDFLARLCQVDHDRTEDFLAIGEDGETIIASAMLAADAQLDRAEVAISVRADHKGRGISWTLLNYLSDYAKAKGIKSLESIESRDNHQAIELEREMGFAAIAYPGDSTLMLVQKDLRPAGPRIVGH